HKFIRDAFQRIYALQSARPRIDVLNPAFERRRQPSFRSCAVVETWLAITGLSLATPPTKRTTRVQRSFDRMPSMLDLGGEDDFPVLLIDDCDACFFRSGIDFDL